MIATRTISRKTKQLRRLKNMTKSQLALKSGISSRTLLRIEQAEATGHIPSMETLNKLAKAFNISLCEFLKAPPRVRTTTA